MNTMPAQDPVAMAEPDTHDNNLILIGSETFNP